MQSDTKQNRIDRPQPSAQGPSRDALRDAIAQEETLLATLEAQQAESRHRLTALRAELAALDTEPEIHVPLALAFEAPIPRTPADKVRLSARCFAGVRKSSRLDSRVGRLGRADTPRRADTSSSGVCANCLRSSAATARIKRSSRSTMPR